MDVKATAEETGGAERHRLWLTAAANPPLHVPHRRRGLLRARAKWSSSWRGRTAGPGPATCSVRGAPPLRGALARGPILRAGRPAADQFFRALGEPAATATLPVPQAPDVERVVAVAAAHDIEILAAPAS
jgi:hypothetical protein